MPLSVARLLLLICLLTGCTGADDRDERRAARARQMRDVTHMLDAMEHPDRARGPRDALPPPASAPMATPAPSESPRPASHRRWRLAVATLALGTLAGASLVRHRRRRRRLTVTPPGRAHFAETPVARPDGRTGASIRPTWIYRTSPFETPLLHMVPAPVDLLPPTRPEPTPKEALALAHAGLQRARQLDGAEAGDACSFALLHAFLAEQEPSLRTEARACRQAVTAFYEALPHRGT